MHVKEYQQKCIEAKLNTDGWIETMYFKIDTIIRGISENINSDNNIFIHSDIDIQFFGDFVKECQKIKYTDDDILFQKGGRSICLGFMVIKANNKTKNFFEEIKKTMIYNKVYDEKAAKFLLNIPAKVKDLNNLFYKLKII